MHATMCYTVMYYPCDQAHSLHETDLRVNSRCMYYFCTKIRRTNHQHLLSIFRFAPVFCFFITTLIDMISI